MPHFQGVKLVLLDIEGTTSSIHFVHQVLFPYSAARLDSYVQAHEQEPAVQAALAQTRETLLAEGQPADSLAQCLVGLHSWIAADRKHGALKALQGMIWKQGFEEGAFQGHLYPDVGPALHAWHAAGMRLAIYSSGSVQAQRLYFGHSQAGNLGPILEGYFDTAVGPKQEADSYRQIAAQLCMPPGAILFLSDQPRELDAAHTAGMQVCQLLREPLPPLGTHAQVADFGQIVVEG